MHRQVTSKIGGVSPITLRTLLIMDLNRWFEHLAGSFCVPKVATRAVWIQCGMHLQTNNKMSVMTWPYMYCVNTTNQRFFTWKYQSQVHEQGDHTHWRRTCNPSQHQRWRQQPFLAWCHTTATQQVHILRASLKVSLKPNALPNPWWLKWCSTRRLV